MIGRERNMPRRRAFSAISISAIVIMRDDGLEGLERTTGTFPILEVALTRIFSDCSPLKVTIGGFARRPIFYPDINVGSAADRDVVIREIFSRFEREQIVYFARRANVTIEVEVALPPFDIFPVPFERLTTTAFWLRRLLEDLFGIGGGTGSRVFVFMRSSNLAHRNILTNLYHLVAVDHPRPLLAHPQFMVLYERENGNRLISVQEWNIVDHEINQARPDVPFDEEAVDDEAVDDEAIGDEFEVEQNQWRGGFGNHGRRRR